MLNDDVQIAYSTDGKKEGNDHDQQELRFPDFAAQIPPCRSSRR
jgi:hypothetical protein